SGDQAPRDALSTERAYPFQRVMAAAEQATLLKPEALPDLKQCLKDDDSGVRYWGAMGILMRGQDAVNASKAELVAALKDSSASVRIAAAAALGQFGGEVELAGALAVLKNDADPTKTSAYAGIAAMNVINALGAKAASLAGFVKTMPTKDEKAVA